MLWVDRSGRAGEVALPSLGNARPFFATLNPNNPRDSLQFDR